MTTEDKPFIPSPFPILLGLIFYSLLIGLVVGLAFPALILQAWLTSIMWGWFVVPTFHVPALSIPVAIGIRLCVRALWGNDSSMTNKNDGNTKTERLTHAITIAYIAPIFVFGMGYIVHLYV